MGLDISFNLKPALIQGMETRIGVEAGLEYDDEDGQMTVEPERIMSLVRLPGQEVWREADLFISTHGTVRAMVRANRWGTFYAPLVDFLEQHDIKWVES